MLDLDGDGDIDVVNTNSGSSNLSILLNNGAGVFGAPTFLEVGFSGEWALAAGDMNEDGLLDVVVGFGTGVAGMAEYVMADSWPGLLTGDGVISGTRGMNLPITGAINAAPNADLFPILWGSAEPSGPVTDAAFETITARILDGIANANPDGIYLDLHGAMITDSHDDGEGELLSVADSALYRAKRLGRDCVSI